MKSASDADLSQFEGLTPQQQQRLTELLDGYLKALEEGTSPDRQHLIAENPDLAEPLASYLESLEYLQDAAAGFGPAHPAIELSDEGSEAERRVGDFQIVREIGRGGMGVVYEARQVSLNRRVALKVLPFAALLDSKQIARFRNEAQAAAQLHHPAIVPVFAIGTEHGVHYYAMQYIDGHPLDRVIAALRTAARPSPNAPRIASDAFPGAPDAFPGAPDASPGACDASSDASRTDAEGADMLTRQYCRSPREYFRSVARLVIQSAEALHAAHEVGVVHRDIKPSNLLLDGSGKLWVTDFGLARCRTDANLTRTGDFIGTMRYMSPEQTRGQPHLVDHRVDIYGLGLTLYELLTLHHAVRGEDPAAILRQLDREQPYRPRLWNRNIPLALENIVSKAIAKSREDRYATALDFAEDLRRFLDGKPTVAQRPTIFERLGKWFWRHKQIVALGMAVLLLVATGTSISTVLLARKERNTQAALREARENERLFRIEFHASQNRLAMLYEESGNPGEAKACLRRAIAEQRKLLEDDPDDGETAGNLATSLNNLARLESSELTREELSQDEETHLAETYLEEALRLNQELVRRFPESEQYRYQLAMSHDQRGRLSRRQGRREQAVGEFQRAIEILEGSATAGSDRPAYAGELAVTWNNLGLTQADLGQFAEAERSLRRAVQCSRAVVTPETDVAEQLSTLAGAYNNLGHVLEQQAEFEEAAVHFSNAIEWQRLASRRAPWDARYGSHLLQHYGHLSRILRQLRRWREAEETVAERFRLCQGDVPQLLALAEDVALLWKAARVSLTDGDGAEQMDRSAKMADRSGEMADQPGEMADRFARRAATLLRQADSLGLDAQSVLQRQAAFRELREDPNFQAWFRSPMSDPGP